MQVPFLGPTYKGRSVNADAERAINFYPEVSPNQNAKSMLSLVGTPGSKLFTPVNIQVPAWTQPAAAANANIVQDPGFESINGEDGFNFWHSIDENISNDLAIAITMGQGTRSNASGIPFAGSWAGEVTYSGDTFSRVSNNLSQEITKLTPGTTYDVTFEAKGDGSAGFVQVAVFDGGFNVLYINLNACTTANSYQQVSFSFKAPATGTAQIAFFANIPSLGVATTAYIDNVSMTKNGTGANLILNSGFETGSGTSPKSWGSIDSSADTPFDAIEIQPGPGVPSNDYHSGSHSCLLSYGTIINGPASMYIVAPNNAQTIAVTPATTYNGFFWTKGDGASGFSQIIVYDSEYNIIYRNLNSNNTSGTWKQVTFTLNVPPGVTSVIIAFFVYSRNSGGTYACYVDDVSLISAYVAPVVVNPSPNVTTPSSYPLRGQHEFNGVLFVVAGPYLVMSNSTGRTFVALGTLTTTSGMVTIMDNGLESNGIGGNHLMVIDGSDGYIYDVVKKKFSVIGSPGFPESPQFGCYIDGYFVVTNGTMMTYCSNLYDGTTWSALAVDPVEATPDPVMACANVAEQLVFIKQNSSEFHYDTGTPTSEGSPFARVQGAVNDFGTMAPFSVARCDQSVIFLGYQRSNETGQFIGVVELAGYQANIISPPSITYMIQNLPSINDAFAYSYSDNGHTFYVLTFPTGDATFVYDTTTQMWHERSTYRDNPFVKAGRHFGNCYAYFKGRHLLGDYRSGNIYEMSEKYYTDDGLPIISIRTAMHLFDKTSLDNVFVHKFQVDMETGSGDGTEFYDGDPQATLEVSRDGGHTWSNPRKASVGKLGNYAKRLIWRQCGYGQSWIPRVTIGAPIKKVLIGADMEATFGSSE